MRKYFILPGLIGLVIISMSFIIIGPKKINSRDLISEKKPVCDCGTPSGLSANRTGGVVHVSWNSAAHAVNYSVGGYRSCDPPFGFMYCASGTSIDIPSSCFITVQVTANCNGTHCTDATCSGGTAGPIQSN